MQQGSDRIFPICLLKCNCMSQVAGDYLNTPCFTFQVCFNQQGPHFVPWFHVYRLTWKEPIGIVLNTDLNFLRPYVYYAKLIRFY